MKGTQVASKSGGNSLCPDTTPSERLAGVARMPLHTIRILIVIDGHASSMHNASFSPSAYGLSHLLDCLAANAGDSVRFEVTRAHRQKDAAATADEAEDFAGLDPRRPHFEHFRFDQPGLDLDGFDEVWLFGIRAGLEDSQGLSDRELEVLARWMDRGGGVFATGGRDDMGAALSGRIPRVRSMRRWGPAPHRADNILYLKPASKTPGTNAPAEDPGETRAYMVPKRYAQVSWPPFAAAQAPHPIMHSPRGAIESLPVHVRQNEALEEIDPSSEFSFGAYRSRPEFPGASGDGPRPEVIAWAASLGGPAPAGPDRAIRPFGCVGAYDGHKAASPETGAAVGRVVVDSSWHHWFDSYHGRTGSQATPESPDGLGHPARDPEEPPLEAGPRDYYRNIALWLAPPAVQRAMLLQIVWNAVARSPLVEDLNLRQSIWHLGARTRDALGTALNLCLLRDWLHALYPPDTLEPWRRMAHDETLPCLFAPPLELLEVASLGGIVREMLSLAASFEQGRIEQLSEQSLAAALVKGAEYGLIELLKTHGLSRGVTDQLMERLHEALDRLPSDDDYVLSSRTRTSSPRPRPESRSDG